LVPPVEAPGQTADAPSEEAVLLKFEEIEPQIRGSVRPHVQALTAAAGLGADRADQQISIAMTPERLELVEPTGRAGLFGFGGGGGVAGTSGGGAFGLGSGLIERLAMIGLAVLSMGLMVSMVRKSGRKVEIPSAQELVGIPPALHSTGDLIGEAEEGDAPLEGIEVSEETVQKDKMLEQVGKLVQEDAPSAARILNRWIQVEE